MMNHLKTKYDELHDARLGSLPRSASATTKVHDADGVLVFSYMHDGKLCGLAFVGRAIKPTWHLAFGTEAGLQAQITETVDALRARAARMAERKAERDKPSTLKVGDILVNSWGYEQTNVDFYEVTALVGKNMIEIRKIGATSVDTDWAQGKATAMKGNYIGPAMRKRVTYGDTVRITSFASARPWDGKPMHWSSYA